MMFRVVFWDILPCKIIVGTFQRCVLPPSSGMSNQLSIKVLWTYTLIPSWDSSDRRGPRCSRPLGSTLIHTLANLYKACGRVESAVVGEAREHL
jgi:hypothetical protein